MACLFSTSEHCQYERLIPYGTHKNDKIFCQYVDITASDSVEYDYRKIYYIMYENEHILEWRKVVYIPIYIFNSVLTYYCSIIKLVSAYVKAIISGVL